jgi:pSer/pThr/pTyr-binding forkhead associated (FHA) protein
MLKLVIEDGDGTTHVVPIIRDQITIGREEGNTIRLTERNVSRHHARLTRSAGEIGTTVILEDLASYNGVRVNGAFVTRKQTLVPDDTMQIGDYFIAIESDEKNTVVSSVLDATSTEMENTEELNPVIEEKDQGRLVVVSSNLAGTCYWINRREMLIGRSDTEGNDLVVKHRSISRHHAKIIFRDEGYTLVDLASSNGVLVNSIASGTTSLVNGDIIEMGHVKLRYCAPGDSYVFQMADIDDVVVVASGQPLRLAVTIGILVLITAASFLLTTGRDSQTDTVSRRVKQPISAPADGSMTSGVKTSATGYKNTRSTPDELLAEARKWAASKEWKTASGVCARLIEDETISPEVRALALQLQKQANQETINLSRLDRLKTLDSALDDEAAMSAELPTTDSVYYDPAQAILNRVRSRSMNTAQSQFEVNVDDGAWAAARVDLRQLADLGLEDEQRTRLTRQLNEAIKARAQDASAADRTRNAIASDVNTKARAKKAVKKREPQPKKSEPKATNVLKPASELDIKPSVKPSSRRQASQLKIFEAAWRIATKDKNASRKALHSKSKTLCNLTDEMNLRQKAIMYCTEQAKYEENIQIKRGLERKVQKWKQ